MTESCVCEDSYHTFCMFVALDIAPSIIINTSIKKQVLTDSTGTDTHHKCVLCRLTADLLAIQL